MNRVLRCGSLIGTLILGLACGTEQPTAPSPVTTPPTVTPPPSPQHFLWANPPAPTFSAVHWITPLAVSPPDRDTSCTRTECSGYGMTRSPMCTWARIARTTQPSSSGSMAGARDSRRGTLKGDLLEVRYSEMMQHSDFENAVYRRSQ